MAACLQMFKAFSHCKGKRISIFLPTKLEILKSETRKMEPLNHELGDLYDRETCFPVRPIKTEKISHKTALKFNGKYERINEPLNVAASELVNHGNMSEFLGIKKTS